ncbi:MAG: hypothetical protein A3J37_04665 [Alphaproteobacteria bacterium RIFCSPHIGHO2_12_FULL_45_9]|nr:MAG: hypothetical protein A3B66_04240 [Alphaproteobacteria bacterium RIFCSPHIGHO2_02_FULL_46_13]OFW94500.1 MAG: hypothetical protein A3J37_04665 [Alphaproteobacteria bacterium RIFCSPHIGHO2_12_FULL_45_9]
MAKTGQKSFKPRLAEEVIRPSGITPLLGRTTPPIKLWTFSFRFWNQIEYFGVGGENKSWFISLLNRLTDMSKLQLEVLKDDGLKDGIRFHEINWDQKNIPLQRDQFDWIPKEYLNNPDDFPFCQFHVSKALGRIVGFFDESQVFNIILLDPRHNIQPCRSFSYAVNSTHIGTCQYSRLVHTVEKFKCASPTCSKAELLASINNKLDEDRNVIIMNINDDAKQRLRTLVDKGILSHSGEALEYALSKAIEEYEALED